MNSPSHPNGYMDFAFVSPHKLLGGPGSSGLLLCKKKHQTNAVPAVCGGGVVLYVSRRGHHYLGNLEEREEAGTPDILGCIRTGAIYHLHRMVGIERIASSEQRMADYLAHRIRAHSKVHVVGPKDRSHCAGIISFNVLYNETDTATKHGLYLHYNFVGAVLNDVFGIQARGGCACAGPYGEALLGLNCGSAERFEEALDDTRYEIFKPGFVRVGVHFTMTQEEVDFVADAILWIADNGWKLLPSYTYKIMSGEWYHIKRDSHQMLKKLSDALSPAAFLIKPDDSSLGNGSTRHSTGSSRRLSTSTTGRHSEDYGGDGLHAAIHKADVLCAVVVDEARRTKLELPLLDPDVADLLWFAHPIDTKWSIIQSLTTGHTLIPQVCVDPECSEIFETASIRGKKRLRPEESIFNIRCWSDGVEPPESAREAARNRQSMAKMMLKMMWLKVTCREKPLAPLERRPIMFAR